MTRTNLFRLLSTMALTAMAATAVAQHQQHANTSAGAAPYDLQFIDMMMHHHQDGIRMAAIEQEEGDRDAVQGFAARTAAGQKKDNEELKAIRDRLFAGRNMVMNARVGGMTMDAMMKKGRRSIEKLEKAGDATDDTFLREMGMHHQDALKMSREGIKRVQDAELRKLATKMHDMQAKELDEITTLRSMTK